MVNSFRHEIGGGFAADGSVSKEAGSPVNVHLEILSAIGGVSCWFVNHGVDDGNPYNAEVLIEIGMPDHPVRGDQPVLIHQRDTPNSFSISAIIGCVKPAWRSSAKSSTMTRSHSLPLSGKMGLPLWAK